MSHDYRHLDPLLAHEAGLDPIEERLRSNVRATIEAVFEEELGSFLGRLLRPGRWCRERLSLRAP